MDIINEVTNKGLRAGIVVATGVKISESPEELKNIIQILIKERKEQEFPGEKLKGEIRNLLKTGGFKATGRNKPASEYLIQALKEDRFPFINNLVDINNYLSVKSAFPISLLDSDITGPSALIRFGKENEKYIFNTSGQELDLKGCICICDEKGEPLGTPVKDSMKGKLKENSENVIGIIFAPSETISETSLHLYCTEFKKLLLKFGFAKTVESFVV